MRVSLASCRGLLSGWLIAATIRLLIDPNTIAVWSAAGLGSRLRIALSTIELLGAAMFAFERSVTPGMVLLLASFALAGAVHVHDGQLPWWLAAYSMAGLLLLYLTRRGSRSTTGTS